jgi:gliding motility-associated lipoprotein GldD
MRKKSIQVVFFVFGLILLFAMSSCGPDEDELIYSPKPRAYFRIDFPKKNYVVYDSTCPFTFETPVYSRVEKDEDTNSEPCWLNIKYPQFNAQVHMSYKAIENNLPKFIEDSREMAIRHQVKATGLDQQPVLRDSAKVFGLMYDIAGNTASSVQFYLTDSTQHFIRGALYFNVAPNIDSQKIVIDYLREDILHLIKTFKWKSREK